MEWESSPRSGETEVKTSFKGNTPDGPLLQVGEDRPVIALCVQGTQRSHVLPQPL